jgi:hypothetical protein
MKRLIRFRPTGMVIGLFMMAVLVSGCGGGGGNGDGGDGIIPMVTFTDIWTDIIQSSCLGSACHSSGGQAVNQTGLDMSNKAIAYANLVGPIGVGVPSFEVPTILRVSPGDPDNSYLIDKLECTADVALGTNCMPQSFPFEPLDQTKIADIIEWITDGAEDN